MIDGNDTISGLSQLRLTATGIAEFNVDLKGRTEKAVIMGEIYRHQGQWKLRAQGQGFNGGLEPLAVSYGVDVAQPENTPPQPARISLEKKPVFLLPNTSWRRLKPESLLFSMPQAL